MADINKQLIDALKEWDVDEIRKLLDAGADPDTVDKSESSALYFAVDAAPFDEKDGLDIVKILLEKGASVNKQNREGMTPLHRAVYLDDKNIVLLLLEHGADKTIINAYGKTPLMLSRSPEMLEILTKGRKRSFPLPPLSSTPVSINPTEEVPYADTLFDIVMAEDTPMVNFVKEYRDNAVIFHLKDQVFGTLRDELRRRYEDKSAIRYECKRQLGLMVTPNDVVIETPYYAMNVPFPIYIPVSQFQQILNSTHKRWKLVETGKLPYTTSRAMVGRPDGTNIDGQDMDAVSADHCQAGTDKPVFSVTPAEMIHSGGKRKTRKRKSKRRRTIRRR